MYDKSLQPVLNNDMTSSKFYSEYLYSYLVPVLLTRVNEGQTDELPAVFAQPDEEKARHFYKEQRRQKNVLVPTY